MEPDNNIEDPIFLPPKIKVSGLPLTMCGWNTVLVYREESNTYNLAPYSLWGLFGIFGGKMMLVDGRWTFFVHGHERCDFYKLEKGPSPIGQWTYGATVTAVDAEKK